MTTHFARQADHLIDLMSKLRVFCRAGIQKHAVISGSSVLCPKKCAKHFIRAFPLLRPDKIVDSPHANKKLV